MAELSAEEFIIAKAEESTTRSKIFNVKIVKLVLNIRLESTNSSTKTYYSRWIVQREKRQVLWQDKSLQRSLDLKYPLWHHLWNFYDIYCIAYFLIHVISNFFGKQSHL